MNLTDRLSKSRYVKGLRCPRALYLSVHRYELATPPDTAQQMRFDVGHRVGDLAQARYPDGILIEEGPLEHSDAVTRTRGLIGQGAATLFEAAFTHDNVKVRVDVLRRLPEGGWELIEVKSTVGYRREKHLPDVGVQLHVLLGSGIDVRRVSLMHLDRAYVYPGGAYDPYSVLAATDVTQDAFEYVREVPLNLARMMAVLALPDVPDRPAGVSCDRPYPCEFAEWCARGEVPVAVDGKLVTEPTVLSRLSELPFPLYFVDFETVNPALPLFPGTSPFQTVKVQWSVHSLDQDGTLTHAQYLVDHARHDPALEFMHSLFETLGASGTFVHYSTFERTALVDIALRYPEWRQPLIERIPGFFDALTRKLADAGVSYASLRSPRGGGLVAFDLGTRVVRDGCSHPILGPRGWSIKRAIQVLAPDLPPYDALVVSDGEQAMAATAEMLAAGTPPQRAEQIRRDLLDYCRHDTLAMVEIYRALHSRA
ncbi:MAG: DUF2779 domain-containing protein [Clostridiales bacterium]|nr:DUF2779 domain-containing protein [Clostridiales bacterium]